ncbi:hypothetical protein PG984_013523 [Apiospora sp. TS-2023a]
MTLPRTEPERAAFLRLRFMYATRYFAQSLVAYPPAKKGTQAESPGVDQALPRNPFTLSSKTNQSSSDGLIPDAVKGTTADYIPVSAISPEPALHNQGHQRPLSQTRNTHATEQDDGGQVNRRKRGGKAYELLVILFGISSQGYISVSSWSGGSCPVV